MYVCEPKLCLGVLFFALGIVSQNCLMVFFALFVCFPLFILDSMFSYFLVNRHIMQ